MHIQRNRPFNFQYYHMNWGGALSWNLAGNYKCDALAETFNVGNKFIYKY